MVGAELVRGDKHMIELFESSKAKALFGHVKNLMDWKVYDGPIPSLFGS